MPGRRVGSSAMAEASTSLAGPSGPRRGYVPRMAPSARKWRRAVPLGTASARSPAYSPDRGAPPSAIPAIVFSEQPDGAGADRVTTDILAGHVLRGAA